MKRITLILSLCLLAFSSWAQDISFIRSFPNLGRTVNECTSMLVSNGCALVKNDKTTNASYLIVNEGEWKNCAIYLFGRKDQKMVRLDMLFPECDSWNSLYTSYTDLVNSLIADFGRPSEFRQEFTGDQQPENDYEKLNEVINGQCSFYTVFQLKGGSYHISIDKQKAVILQFFKY